jgi:hypothetical protein
MTLTWWIIIILAIGVPVGIALLVLWIALTNPADHYTGKR